MSEILVIFEYHNLCIRIICGLIELFDFIFFIIYLTSDLNEIRGKLKNLKSKERKKSQNRLMKNNVSELKKIYKKMDKEKERDSFTSQKKISSKNSNHGKYL